MVPQKLQKFGLKPLPLNISDQELVVVTQEPFWERNGLLRERIVYDKKFIAVVPNVDFNAITRSSLL